MKYIRFGAFFCSALVLGSYPSQLTAEEPLKEVVVTANRYETEQRKTGSSTTKVTADDIKKRKHSSVLEVLRDVEGLEVVQVGGRGRQTSVFIRGNEADHTLVLIDGLRVNSNADGAFDFADLRADQIEKIEIVRGAQSVLYGSEAIGGVVSITTKKAGEELNASAKVSGGSHGTQEYSASAGWGAASVHSLLTASYLETDGISAAQSKNRNSEADGYENISLSNRSGITFGENGSVDLSARFFRGETELDGFAFGEGAVDDLNSTQEREFFSGNLQIKDSVTDWLTPTLSIGLMDETLEGKDPDTEFSNFEIGNRTISSTAQFDITAIENNIVSVGYTFEKREANNVNNFDESRDVHSVFLQDQLSLADSLFLTAGVRYDDDSEFGDATTFRATIAYLIEKSGTRLHGSFGTGFKAPSFNELFFPDFGNPELKEETSVSFDLGVEQSVFDNLLTMDVTYFQSRVDDLITFDSESFLAANIEEADIWGFETGASIYPCEHFTGRLTYTFTDAENKTTGAELFRRPRHRATASIVTEPVEDLHVVASLLLVNHRTDTDGAKMNNYERVDVAVSYEGIESFTPFIRVENLFDESYEEIPGYGTPGFEVFGGVSVDL